MKSLVRILTIAAVVTLSVATLAPAQRGTEVGAKPVAQPSFEAGTAAPGGADFNVVNRQYAQAQTNVSVSVPPPRIERAPGRRGSSRYGSSTNYGRLSSSSVSRSKRLVFIIPAAEMEREDHLAIERDIHVMSHIFDRVLKNPVNKIGGVFTVMDDFFGRDSHVTQVIYADGYGAMFFMDVDLALVGPPPTSEAKEPNMPEERVDTAWKQAERELYAPPNVTRNTDSRSGSEYHAEKVEMLKRNLVDALKHAANIQALKSDESVILTVTGRTIMVTTAVRGRTNVEWVFDSGRWELVTKDPTTASYGTIPPSVLTIRAKKSDIDAFSKGELNFNKFYERVQLLANWSGSAGMTPGHSAPAGARPPSQVEEPATTVPVNRSGR